MNDRLRQLPWWSVPLAVLIVLAIVAYPVFQYMFCRIEVPRQHIAILVKKTGEDLTNDQEIAPGPEFKGLQMDVLNEGRHFRNPWYWDWEIVPHIEIPADKLGVRIRLYGDDLPYGQLIAQNDDQKGIVAEPLRPARYPLNAWVVGSEPRQNDNYVEVIELHDPIVVPAGYKGVLTNLSGPMPEDPNVLLVGKGQRGVQEETASLDPGTYYFNPYVYRVELIDCRSKRFDLSEGGEMGFPSKDGFWVSLDGTIEFRVMPERAAHVYVAYNEIDNDANDSTSIEEEIIRKVIVPNARSFCRLRGSNHSGKEFISGDTRTKFQIDFQEELARTCESQGIQIIQALITRIYPPQKIAEPVRARQIARQEELQYGKQILQQESEKELAIEQEMIKRKQALIEAEREVVKLVTAAQQQREVALIQTKQELRVAELQLESAEDMAAAIAEKGRAAAEVVQFGNKASAAGWQKAVRSFGQDGAAYARWVLLKKLAPSYRQMMVNTADSPIMDIFRQFETPASSNTPKAPEPAGSDTVPAVDATTPPTQATP